MPIEVHRPGHGEVPLIQSLHICKLLGSGYAGEIEPGGFVAVCVVVPFVFYVTEAGTA